MSIEDDKREVARRAAAILQCAQDQITEAARQVEAQTGEKLLHRRPPISDAGRGDLERLLVQVRTATEALELALQWVGVRDRLGAVLKRMPRDAAVELAEKLRAAGLDV